MVKEFIESYITVRGWSGAPTGVLLDGPMTEFAEAIVDKTCPKVIGRYPRRYGKTNTLIGSLLYEMLTSDIVIGYVGPGNFTAVEFLKKLVYAYKQLPHHITQGHTMTESIECLKIDQSKIFPIRDNQLSHQLWAEGKRTDVLIYDDLKTTESQLMNDLMYTKRIIVVGSFPLNSDLGRLWLRENSSSVGFTWDTLPNSKHQGIVDAVLAMCDPKYGRHYKDS